LTNTKIKTINNSFISYTPQRDKINTSPFNETDGVILNQFHSIEDGRSSSKKSLFVHRVKTILGSIFHLPLHAYEYKDAMKYFLVEDEKQDNVIPDMLPNFDLSPRRQFGAYILKILLHNYLKSTQDNA